jgi:hypothetical protein
MNNSYVTVASEGLTQTTRYIPITKKKTAIQLKTFYPPQVMVGSQLVKQLGSCITPASNMIDLTINKPHFTRDDFQGNWQVVQDIKKKKESKQPTRSS